MVALQTVEFQNDKLDIIDNFVSVRKICENIGLTGLSDQYRKIQANAALHSRYIDIEINNVIQTALFIPLNKLNGWLFSINPNKVKPEVKQKLIDYQEECFDVLHKHFMPVAPTVAPTQLNMITPYEVRRDLATARRMLTLEKNKHRKSVETLEATIEELKIEKQALRKVDGMYDVGLVTALTANLVQIEQGLSKEQSRKLMKYALDIDADIETPTSPYYEGLINKNFLDFMHEASYMKDDIQTFIARYGKKFPAMHLELNKRHHALTRFLFNIGEAYRDMHGISHRIPIRDEIDYNNWGGQ